MNLLFIQLLLVNCCKESQSSLFVEDLGADVEVGLLQGGVLEALGELDVLEVRHLEMACDYLERGHNQGLVDFLWAQVHEQHEEVRFGEYVAVLDHLLDEIRDVGQQVLQLGVPQRELYLHLRV